MSMVAIPVFRARVAPVLDWCSKILIVSEEEPQSAVNREINVQQDSRFALMRSLRQQGISIVICGALSPEMLNYGESIGLRIIHGIAGDIGEVLEAYRKGELDRPRYWLPGCRGQRRYKGGGRCTAKASSQQTEGLGSHSAEAGLATPSADDKRAGGPGGLCVCPKCGATLRHERGVPCSQMHCPTCSAAMTRKMS